MLHTPDGGKNWSAIATSITADIEAIHFIDAEVGWSAGIRPSGVQGVLLQTLDGGMTWFEPLRDLLPPLRSMHWRDPNHGLVVGDLGTILETRDGGQNWERYSLPTRQEFRSVFSLADGTAIAGGLDGGLAVRSETPPM